MRYKTIEQLQQHKTQLLDTVQIGSGMQMASWSNHHDRVQVCSDHHTLSLYVRDGYDIYQKTNNGWKNGGGPDHFCLMPQGQDSTWDLRGNLSFVHLYYTDTHLRDIAVKIWDKEPKQIQLNALSFVKDPIVSLAYRQFLLSCDWHDAQNQLQLSSASNLLLNHLLQNYSNVLWKLPKVTGGIAPYSLKRVLDWIEDHLHLPLTIADLAQQAELSEYHFAHMFKQSMNMPPHQYVLQQRLNRAHHAVTHSTRSLTEIAFECGFSSAGHFSTRFKQQFGYTPSQLRP